MTTDWNGEPVEITFVSDSAWCNVLPLLEYFLEREGGQNVSE